MPGTGVTDMALTYAHESFNRYYFGRELRMASHVQQSLSFFLEHGFSDSLSLVLTLPYMWSARQPGSLQDATLALKYRPLQRLGSRGTVSLTGAGGISFPAAAYAVDTLFPLGIRATSLLARLVLQANFRSGWFVHTQAGVDWRVLPNVDLAMPVLLRAGYGARWYYVEAWLEWHNRWQELTGMGGIGEAGADWLRVGGVLYVPLRAGLGLVGGWTQVLRGRDIGLSGRGHVGLVWRLRQEIPGR